MERIDDLERNGLKIIQDPEKFCFGIDAVLLTGFARIKPGAVVVDIGSGTGIIPILLSAKSEGRYFYGIELQTDMAKMSERSVSLNGLEDKVKIINCDINESASYINGGTADAVTCNPPYMSDMHGLKNPSMSLALARHEIKCTLEDVVREGARMLKTGGRYFLVHRPSRLAEIFAVLGKYRLEPKRMRLVYPYEDREANLVLIEAVKGGGRYLRVEKPLIVYKSSGEYAEEVKKIYYG